MVGQLCRDFMKTVSWARVSEHLVKLIGMSDQLKWNNQYYSERVNLTLFFFFLKCNLTFRFSQKVKSVASNLLKIISVDF